MVAFTPYRRSLQEMREARPFTPAEERLIAECRQGEVIALGWEVPEGPLPEVEIRGELIRHLMLGGCDEAPVPPTGVPLAGAWVGGELDLRGCESPLDLTLFKCGFAKKPVFRDARIGALHLSGSHVPGLDAHRLRAEKSVFLRQDFRSRGTVDLGGAQIGGQLSCANGRFDGGDGVALDGDALTVGASVLLCDGFHATGEVCLRGAQIGGQLACDKGRFDGGDARALNGDSLTVGTHVLLRNGFHSTGEVNLVRAQIKGNLQCIGGAFETPFDGEGMQVGAGFFWQDLAEVPKRVDLTDAHVGSLRDDVGSWEGVETLHLGGFRYDRVLSEMSVRERLAWLGRKREAFIEPAIGDEVKIDGSPRPLKRPPGWLTGAYEPKFDPQPYTQLARVLRAQGAGDGAARVMARCERLLRRAMYHRAMAAVDGSWAAAWNALLAEMRRLVDWGFRVMFGYGYRPFYALFWMLGIWGFCVWLYGSAYQAGQMAPASDVVLTSDQWIGAVSKGCPLVTDAGYDDARAAGCRMPLRLWEKTEPYRDYETFSRGLYALDLFVPLDALGQENAWAPSRDRGRWGFAGFYLRWLVQVMGWVITAVGAATLTGLIGRRE